MKKRKIWKKLVNLIILTAAIVGMNTAPAYAGGTGTLPVNLLHYKSLCHYEHEHNDLILTGTTHYFAGSVTGTNYSDMSVSWDIYGDITNCTYTNPDKNTIKVMFSKPGRYAVVFSAKSGNEEGMLANYFDVVDEYYVGAKTTDIYLKKGDTKQLSFEAFYCTGASPNGVKKTITDGVIWSTSDNAVVSVNNGKITALADGETYINAYNHDLTGNPDQYYRIHVGDEVPVASPGSGTTSNNSSVSTGSTITASIKKGSVVTVSGAKYTVVSTSKRTVQYTKPVTDKATMTIPATVKISGKTYKVTSIAANAFRNNSTLNKITIGKNVTSIGKNAFYGCEKLRTAAIGKSVTTIGASAFYKCTALTTITIPSKVTSIGAKAFSGDIKLKTITIKTTKLTSKKIGSQAFKGIYKKATIKAPKSKLSSYKRILKSKGVSSKAKFKKI